MLNVLNTHVKGHHESFGDDGYVCYLDCSDSITSACMRVIRQNVYIKICAVLGSILFQSSSQQTTTTTKTNKSELLTNQSVCAGPGAQSEGKSAKTASLIPDA